MRVRSTVFLFLLVTGLTANDAVDRAHKFEDAGDSAAARDVYSKAVLSSPKDPEVLAGYAQILERYRDPGAREAWRKSALAWKTAGKMPDAATSAKRAVLLDLIAGDRPAAEPALSADEEARLRQLMAQDAPSQSPL